MLNGYQPCRFGQVHYRFAQPQKASGKLPFLCLHASPGSSRGYMDFLPMMGTDRLAIAADTPGYGLSDRPPAPSTIGDFAAAMGDLVDAMGLKRIDLLGNHTSSATALELARQRPRLVRKIILNSALMFTPEDLVKMKAGVANVAASDLEAAAARIPENWKAFRKFRPDMNEERAWLLFWEMNRDPMHLDWGYAASFDYDFAKTLVQITQPILILNPNDVLFAITSRARAVVPNGRVLDLPWTGGTFGVHAAEVAALARDFLDG
nr:alpha/beta fold hydrolase [Sphingobium boeckii]